MPPPEQIRLNRVVQSQDTVVNGQQEAKPPKVELRVSRVIETGVSPNQASNFSSNNEAVNLNHHLATDHFQHSSKANASHVQVKSYPDQKSETHSSFIETGSIFSSKMSLFSSLQGEVRELLKTIASATNFSSNSSSKNSSLSFSSVKNSNISVNQGSAKTGAALQENKAAAASSIQWGSNATSLQTRFALPLSQSAVTSLNTALTPDAVAQSSSLQLALKSTLGSLQSFFPNERLNVLYNNSSLGNVYPSSLGQEEGLHFIQWSNQLGVPLQALALLLPFVVQVQEAAPQAHPALQGLFSLFGLFGGIPQMSMATLTWPYLKGMMILENYAKLNLLHSPLLDELGALLSTSRRRLRKEAKKRISSLDKVTRKDAYLADADTQENEEDLEALIDLWPKKESNNSSTAFYYM